MILYTFFLNQFFHFGAPYKHFDLFSNILMLALKFENMPGRNIQADFGKYTFAFIALKCLLVIALKKQIPVHLIA